MAVEAINSGFYGKWAIFPLLESILLQIKTMLGRPFCELMYGTRRMADISNHCYVERSFEFCLYVLPFFIFEAGK